MYSIGLDIGTGSVGWCVVDKNGKLLKFKRKNMWGVRLFSSADPAEVCRINRSTRRRYARRRQRIMELRKIMKNIIDDVDSNFFQRLNESFLWKEDKKVKTEFILFDSKKYSDIQFYREYPTVYHLRKYLLETDEKADPRKIYLALHHMLKYRGNFLYEGQKFDAIESAQDSFVQLINELTEQLGLKYIYSEKTFEIIEEILKNESAKKKKKEEIINILVKENWDKKYATEIVNAILGYSFNLSIVLENEELRAEDGKARKTNFNDAKYEQDEIELQDILGEKFYIIESLKQIYSWFTLKGILQGEKYISDAMVAKYEKHHAELVELKRLFREYVSDKEYNEFFRRESKKGNNYVANYANYIKGMKRCGGTTSEAKKNLYKEINRILGDKAKDDIRYVQILNEMEQEKYLEKQNEVCNAHIPYQLNEMEMEKILNRQGKFYPELQENKNKIMKLLQFRIPYFVGPLNPYKGKREFAWMNKKEGMEQEKIYPWNFEKVVDIDTTAEAFITRMTGYCTYLPAEKVLPKQSLLYQKFEVLQELNKITINRKSLGKKDRDQIIEELFKKKKKVTDAQLKTHLANRLFANNSKPEDYFIEGYQKDKEFASSMSSFVTFKNIFGQVDASNEQMIEEIIYWLTVFEEKSIIKRKIKQKYADRVSDVQLKQILKLRYTGWGQLSEKFLNGIRGDKGSTIIKMLCDDDKRYKGLPNLMQILATDETIAKTIEENRKKYDGTENLLDVINQLYTSPAIKRGIWQSMNILEEIKDIMGEEPEQVFIEFAREDGEKVRTSTRKNKIEKALKKIKEEIVDEYNKKVEEELKEKKYSERLDEEKVYLYFMQNGKCLYSGASLNIEKLSEYEVDHIIPQSVIDDDSLDNKALVLKSMNQNKGNRLVMETYGEQIKKNKINLMWRKLYEIGLISPKKYANLQKESIGEVLTRGFINRQLVETRQIVKAVANLVKDYYQNRVKVVEVKAELSSSIRKKYTLEKKDEQGYFIKRTSGYMLFKNRELNDFHHAHDAYLAAIIGMYIQTVYPKCEKDLIYGEYKKRYKKYYDENKGKDNQKHIFHCILNKFDQIKCDDDGVIVWNGEEMVSYMKNIFGYRDCFVSRKVEENTGAFYNETIYPKACDGASKLIPLKKGLDVTKYGGYQGGENAYFVLVRYSIKKKRKMEFIGIPIYVALEMGKGNIQLADYLKEKLNVDNVEVLRKKVQKYQYIEDENQNQYYLVGPKEVINAKQLVLGGKYKELNRVIAYLLNGNWEHIEKKELEKSLSDLYEFLQEKIIKEYTGFAATMKKISDTNAFEKLTLEEKGQFLLELLKLTKASPEYPALKKFKISGLADRMGRKNGFTIKDKIVFVDTSVTGMHERRTCFELENSCDTKSCENQL